MQSSGISLLTLLGAFIVVLGIAAVVYFWRGK
jgi:hypothetical protein